MFFATVHFYAAAIVIIYTFIIDFSQQSPTQFTLRGEDLEKLYRLVWRHYRSKLLWFPASKNQFERIIRCFLEQALAWANHSIFYIGSICTALPLSMLIAEMKHTKYSSDCLTSHGCISECFLLRKFTNCVKIVKLPLSIITIIFWFSQCSSPTKRGRWCILSWLWRSKILQYSIFKPGAVYRLQDLTWHLCFMPKVTDDATISMTAKFNEN